MGVVEWHGEKRERQEFLAFICLIIQPNINRYFSLAMVTKMVATWSTDMLQILLFSLPLVMLTKLKLEKKTEATVLQKKKKIN